ncbi:hypothetical protein QFC20_006984 [Naganishia adeliensis]|uniref:Uncharacterized protein n=1 Tax=Naganishia adeliensis TaxID=92952 RepID=A0ACC2V4T9_9TREE|nr:hypothetical protein QFC20_006984 [Naganishia adeliensis]
MVHPMALSSLFPNPRPQKLSNAPLPAYERLLDLCATHAQSTSDSPSYNGALNRQCPLLALHTSLTDLQTYLSNPLRAVHPPTGHELQWETGMQEMTRTFTRALTQGVKEVRMSGMQDDEVRVLVGHAEGIVKGQRIKADTMMGMDETTGFLLL